MPALQVREFPDDLYEQLKQYAASQHRSMAQQTIVAVEQMIEAGNADQGQCVERRPGYLDFDTKTQRAARIKKRMELFEEIHALPKVAIPPDFPDTVELIRQGRAERDAYIDEVLANEMGKAREA